jgi:hypothetical protein
MKGINFGGGFRTSFIAVDRGSTKSQRFPIISVAWVRCANLHGRKSAVVLALQR